MCEMYSLEYACMEQSNLFHYKLECCWIINCLCMLEKNCDKTYSYTRDWSLSALWGLTVGPPEIPRTSRLLRGWIGTLNLAAIMPRDAMLRLCSIEIILQVIMPKHPMDGWMSVSDTTIFNWCQHSFYCFRYQNCLDLGCPRNFKVRIGPHYKWNGDCIGNLFLVLSL